MKKLVSNQLCPNFTIKTAWQAFSCLRFLNKDEDLDFSEFLETKNYLITNAARTALSEISKIVDTDKKIGIPSICCAVMATPFLAQGKEIEWIDCDKNGLIDLKDLKKKADKIGIVIIPHTFGQQVDMQKVFKIVKSREIFIIEDGAHFFAPISKYADAQILSFGREKDVSCVSGGALIWNEESKYTEKFREISLPESNKIWTIKHLLQPLILALSLRFWFYGGRFFAGFWSKLKLFPRAVTPAEKCGTEDFPQTKMPKATQAVLMQSFRRHKETLEHRKKLAKKWQSVLPAIFPESKIIIPNNFFRGILINVNRVEIKKQAKKIGFDLNEWDGNPISPAGVNLAKFGYQNRDCPNAEKFMKNYITLPTNVRTTEMDVENFVGIFSSLFLEKRDSGEN